MIKSPGPEHRFLDARGKIDPRWLRFLESLSVRVEDGTLAQQLSQLAEQVTALGGQRNVIGRASVTANGDGTIYVQLRGDADNPGASYLYGTDGSGAKGWWRVFDVINADTDDFVQTDSGYVVLGEVATPGDLPGSGSTGEAWRVTDVSPGLYAWDGSAFALDASATGIVGLALANVPDSGTGTLQKTAFDAKGRKTGTASATTTDLPEGGNLYYTDERAAAAAPVQSVNGKTGAVSIAYADLGGVVPTWNQNTTGSAAKLTTPRTLTIGSTGKAFDGSGDVAWSLAEIGAPTQTSFDSLEGRVDVVEAGQTAGMLGYATKAAMDADLAHAEDTLALVTNDTTPANNGTYRKTGASGAGSWVLSADRVSMLEGQTANYRAAGDPVGANAPDGYAYSVEDAYGKVALGITNDGTVEVSKLVQIGGAPSYPDRHGGVFDAQMNLVVGFGQSLMQGSTSFGTSLTTSQEYDNIGFKRVAASPTAYYPLTVADTAQSAGESPIYGCAGMVKELIATENGLAWQDNDYQMLMVNDGQSGASITLLEKGGTSGRYELAQGQVTSAMSIATSEQRSMKHQAVIFAQGEADESMDKDVYKGKLVKLASDFNTDSRASTGQSTPVSFITYQVGEYAGRNTTVQAQYEAAQESPLIVMASPIYFMEFVSATIDGAGSTHLVPESTKWLGGYYGLAYKRKIIDGQDWVPLRPVAHAVNGNTIDLHMSKRGLVFDTTMMPAQASQGFTVKDASNADVAITSVSIVAGNRVRITCASNVQPGWSVQYGHIQVAGKSNYTGCGGNLRDSQGDVIAYSAISKPMHNWCVIFNYSL